MEFTLSNKRQHEIADMLWQAESLKEAHAIVKKFGVDGVIVYNMMMAHIYDEVDDIDVAEEILNRIKNGT